MRRALEAALTRSLVIAPQWIGDAVMTEPLLRRLHARGERITVGALPWVAPIYRAMPQVAEVVEFPFAHGGVQFSARRQLAHSLTGQFDVAYVLPNSLKSALLPFLASIPKRVGYLGEARVGLLTHRLKNPPRHNRPPMVGFYSALSGEAGEDEPERPQLSVSALSASAYADAFGVAHEAADVAAWELAPPPYVVVVPGSEYGPAKRWPAAYFAQLAAQLMQELGLNVVVLGSSKEADLGLEIEQLVQKSLSGKTHQSADQPSPPRLLSLTGKTQLSEAMQWIAGARAVVCNDTGLMHVAAALNVPQVALFGSSSPVHTPPLSDVAQVMWLKQEASYQPPLDCAPCFERECPLGHMRCLNDLSVARVWAQLHAELKQPQTAEKKAAKE